MLEKEVLLGYNRNETASPHVTEVDRSIRLGRALDANVMRWIGVLLAATQAWGPCPTQPPTSPAIARGGGILYPAFTSLHYQSPLKTILVAFVLRR